MVRPELTTGVSASPSVTRYKILLTNSRAGNLLNYRIGDVIERFEFLIHI